MFKMFFDLTKQSTFTPDTEIIVTLLNACRQAGSLKHGEAIIKYVKENELLNNKIKNSAALFYARMGNMNHALTIIRKYPEGSTNITCDLLREIRYSNKDCADEVIGFIDSLNMNFTIPEKSEIIRMYGRIGELTKALRHYKNFIIQKPAPVLHISAIDACADCCALFVGDKLIKKIPDISPNISIKNAIIHFYGATWRAQKAVNMFFSLSRGVINQPNKETCLIILDICTQVMARVNGLRVVEYIERKTEFKDSIDISLSIIKFKASCGMLSEAFEAFSLLAKKSLTASHWSVIIKICSENLFHEKSFQYYDDMIKNGVSPNNEVFAALLLLKDEEVALDIYNTMIPKYGIPPEDNTNKCIVDMYGMQGKIREAVTFIKSIPLPSHLLWSTLLVHCRKNNNLKSAERIFNIIQTNFNCTMQDYENIRRLYAYREMWDKAQAVANKQKNLDSYNLPPVSQTEVDGNIVRLSPDKNHVKPIEHALTNARHTIQDRFDYVADVTGIQDNLSGASREEIVDHLWRHSEKIALAYNLVRPNTRIMKNEIIDRVIRISSNTSMCDDCHRSFILISEAINSSIVVKDTDCLHEFAFGACSCRVGEQSNLVVEGLIKKKILRWNKNQRPEFRKRIIKSKR
ncbi:hypothetical protein AKO1_011575 [Acrasis kona]|uniref:DYW domain-containing protein n=1 Tax=Acrasis kona TaxID=1008807 RepID=A0AAW2Z791_9EUKA